MDEAYKVGERVELITPARFLFDAGDTPSEWNKKMLNDEHLQVKLYESNAARLFPDTDIKGGVAVTYRDSTRTSQPIKIFTVYPELNSILQKTQTISTIGLNSIISNRGLYRFSKLAYIENPEEMTKVSDSRILSSAFERFPLFFFENKPKDGREYISIYGRLRGDRVYRWMRRGYLADNDNINKYKVMVPKANGSGAIGEVLSTPLIGEPLIGFTETFIAVGNVDSRIEAEAILRYVKSKFARAMLGILKITQDNPPAKWKYVPLQDFTSASDIDWSQSVAEIDRQFYQKYGLSPQEIDFIETHVKEMD